MKHLISNPTPDGKDYRNAFSPYRAVVCRRRPGPANYRVTPEERESLSNAAMMGEVTCERDVLFILNQLRRARLRW